MPSIKGCLPAEFCADNGADFSIDGNAVDLIETVQSVHPRFPERFPLYRV